jgi:hypothetical protein
MLPGFFYVILRKYLKSESCGSSPCQLFEMYFPDKHSGNRKGSLAPALTIIVKYVDQTRQI